MEPILKLRAEKWEGVNEELHECYTLILKGMGDDLEEKRKYVESIKDDLPF